MLTALRNSAQSWMIKLLLGMIVITFIISFGIGTFSNPKEVLVKVGSDEILVNQFLRQYQEQLDSLRQRFPDNAETLANQLNLREQVMNQLVDRNLLLRAAQAQGLIVTAEEVQDAVINQPAFQLNQKFDFQTYRQVLQQNNLSPTEYEGRLKDDLLITKLQRFLLAGLIVNQAELDQRYQVENQKVEVDYLFVDPQRVTLPKPPDLAAQKAFYEKNPARFTQPAQFRIRYFTLALSDLEKSSDVSDRAVERYYERNADTEFSTPKKVRASHILIRLPQNATPEQVAQARKELEGLLAQARAGKDFAGLARTYSQDPSKDKGGDLGYFSKDEMVAAFADASFALNEGQISDVVRTPFGLHIIKITGVKPQEKQPFSAVKAEIEKKLITARAEHRLDLELQRLPASLGSKGLEPVAKELGATVKTSDWFDGSQVLPALGSSETLYNQVKSRRKGEVGVWRRNPVQGHVFYQVEDKKEPFVKPFDSVQKEVAALTAAEQRREAALSEAKAVYPKLKTAADFVAFARRSGEPIQTVSFTATDPSIEGLGVNHDFQQAAFRLNDKSPFALSIKDNQAYLLRFKRRFFPEPDKAAEIKQQIAARMENTLQQYVLDSEIARLRSQVQIKVEAPEYLMASSSSTPPPSRAY
jgi:peptidyl-prolyl cis-trans isomerase D